MYKHLLVPLDDTPLSTASMVSAITLAQALRARITFFHATPDAGATDDGALIRLVEPDVFARNVIGETNVVLEKAIVAARVAGVSCETAARTSDHPAEAIIRIAQERGCDLIVMASRGSPSNRWRSWLNNSQTERVLRHAPVALLVTRVAAEHPLSHSERATGIIVDEHRAMAVVVSAMRSVSDALLVKLDIADVSSLAAMVAYLRQFPERMHHPREEEHLHVRMRARDPACAPLLDEIEAQHVVEGQLINRVLECLDRFDAAGVVDVNDVSQAVQNFAKHVFEHLKLEETRVLPWARECLQDEDWSAIADAFVGDQGQSNSLRLGDLSSSDFRQMFTQIANVIAARDGH